MRIAARAGCELPRRLMRIAFAARALLLYLLEPIDYLHRLVNGKQDLPPLQLRRCAGPLATLESSGAEFAVYLKLLCRLSSRSRILDIGCGFGLVALYLRDYLKDGQYVGLDIFRTAIRWAERRITTKYPNFRFLHVDVKNPAYNPGGTIAADKIVLPLPSESFDVVLVKSVFTHMRLGEIENYIREISRLLAPGGRCLATLFLLNPEQEKLSREGLNALEFRFGDAGGRCVYYNLSEAATAVEEGQLEVILKSASLTLREVLYGTWSGRRDGLSYQDLVLISKADGLRASTDH